MLSLSEAPSSKADSMAATPRAAIDRAIATVADARRAFARMSPAAKAGLLRSTLPLLGRVANAWVAAGRAAKGLRPEGAEGGEDWLSGPMPVVRNVRLLVQSLEQIADRGRP